MTIRAIRSAAVEQRLQHFKKLFKEFDHDQLAELIAWTMIMGGLSDQDLLQLYDDWKLISVNVEGGEN